MSEEIKPQQFEQKSQETDENLPVLISKALDREDTRYLLALISTSLALPIDQREEYENQIYQEAKEMGIMLVSPDYLHPLDMNIPQFKDYKQVRTDDPQSLGKVESNGSHGYIYKSIDSTKLIYDYYDFNGIKHESVSIERVNAARFEDGFFIGVQSNGLFLYDKEGKRIADCTTDKYPIIKIQPLINHQFLAVQEGAGPRRLGAVHLFSEDTLPSGKIGWDSTPLYQNTADRSEDPIDVKMNSFGQINVIMVGGDIVVFEKENNDWIPIKKFKARRDSKMQVLKTGEIFAISSNTIESFNTEEKVLLGLGSNDLIDAHVLNNQIVALRNYTMPSGQILQNIDIWQKNDSGNYHYKYPNKAEVQFLSNQPTRFNRVRFLMNGQIVVSAPDHPGKLDHPRVLFLEGTKR